MASIRRLLSSSGVPRRSGGIWPSPHSSTTELSGRNEGPELEAIRRFSTSKVASEIRTEDQTSVLDPSNSRNELEDIRREFEAAKRNFLNNSFALKEIPLMNPRGIYVNKNVKLEDIEVYGFDYDYTLAHYSGNVQTLIYDLAKEHLVNEHKYPASCLKFQYDPEFPIRGLYFDRLKGNLLKLDFFGSIEPDGCFFGRRKLSLDEIIATYGTRHIGRESVHGLVGLMDFFCFSEACLIADVVQHFVDAKLEFDPCYIHEDVNHAIQRVHRSGLLHKRILSDPEKYLVKNGKMFKFLETLKERGKKLFMLTNSPFHFVDGGMCFMLEGCGGRTESWRDLFDVVIAQANKPNFYTSEHPFRCYDIEKDTLAFTAVDRFLPNHVYYHGCLKSFLQITKWKGPEVIYFGDHLFSDLRGPSRAGWRTAAIIHELEKEIEIQNNQIYRFQQAKFHVIQELLGKCQALDPRVLKEQDNYELVEELNLECKKCRSTMRNMFNGSFGATFLTDTGQESAFSYHIHQFADVYTSKPENFLLHPSHAWLHVPYDIKIMPHHVKVSSTWLTATETITIT